MTTPEFPEIAADQLGVQHIGARAKTRWPDPLRYEVGTIMDVTSDKTSISADLAGGRSPFQFIREEALRLTRNRPDNVPARPVIYLWTPPNAG